MNRIMFDRDFGEERLENRQRVQKIDLTVDQLAHRWRSVDCALVRQWRQDSRRQVLA